MNAQQPSNVPATPLTSSPQSQARFARWVFRLAGIYGLVVITPLFFSEGRLGQAFPPVINHPEFFHGFASVGLAWQLLFLLLATDPRRFRLMMLPAFVEKAGYVIAISVLFLQERVTAASLFPASVDLIFGMLFLVAFWSTREPRHQNN
jgi:hypothetical protein